MHSIKIILLQTIIFICFLLIGTSCNTEQAEQQETEALAEESPAPSAEVDKMDWWKDARFGMFIHWGAYAIPAGIHNGEEMEGIGEWIMDKLQIPIEDYEKYVAQFNPEKFNAQEWVGIAKNAGMKYIVITSKHHDGFCLWDSKVTEYDIMDAAPFKRDILKELADACEEAGIRLCFYHSIMDWHHPQAQAIWEPNYNRGRKDTAVNPEFSQYFQNYLKPQVEELMTNYGDIGVMWFDGEWVPDYTTEMGKELFNFIIEKDPDMIVNNRVDKGRKGMEGLNKEGNFVGDFGTPEQEIPDTGIEGVDWESCMTMNDTWGFKKNDDNWKSTETLLQNLIDIVSKGGNFLLNVGPTAEGLIPEASIQRLQEMGDWMKVNSEAIYGAQASPFDKPEWGRFTQKDNKVYVHIFDWPEDGKLEINQNINLSKAYLLADAQQADLEVENGDGKLTLNLPAEAPDKISTVVALEITQE